MTAARHLRRSPARLDRHAAPGLERLTSPRRDRHAAPGRVVGLLGLALLAATLGSGCGGRVKPSVAKLDWLTGCWSGKVEGSVVDEQWSRPAGGSILGTSRQIRDGKTVGREYREIDETGGNLVLVLHAEGGQDARFKLLNSGRSDVTFTRDEADPGASVGSPGRLAYHRRGNTLFVRSEAFEDGRKVERKLKLSRNACE